jgi:hypothetical protein
VKLGVAAVDEKEPGGEAGGGVEAEYREPRPGLRVLAASLHNLSIHNVCVNAKC